MRMKTWVISFKVRRVASGIHLKERQESTARDGRVSCSLRPRMTELQGTVPRKVREKSGGKMWGNKLRLNHIKGDQVIVESRIRARKKERKANKNN